MSEGRLRAMRARVFGGVNARDPKVSALLPVLHHPRFFRLTPAACALRRRFELESITGGGRKMSKSADSSTAQCDDPPAAVELVMKDDLRSKIFS